MEEIYLGVAVRIGKSLRFYTARSSERAACEAELIKQRLTALVWVEGASEEEAIEKAMQAAALQMLCRD